MLEFLGMLNAPHIRRPTFPNNDEEAFPSPPL